MTKRWLAVAMLFAAVIAAPASLWTFGGTASAVFVGADIGDASGPLTHIYIGQNMSCQVAHTGDVVFEMYSPSSQQGDCGTFVLVGGTLYGNGSFTSDAEFTFVSQSAVTGVGSSVDPFQVVTVGDAGTSGIRVTETDTYTIGDEFYRTDIQVANAGNSSADVRIYRGADCYLGGSDLGYGYADPVGKVVACTANVNNSPPGRIEEWTPITPADHYYESTCCAGVEDLIGAHGELPDTCDCSTHEDNGAAIDWNRTIAVETSVTVSHFTTFSPLGVGAPTPTPGTAVASTTVPCSQSVAAPCKTHTPTTTPTSTNTPTALPVTNTPVPSPTLVPPTVAPSPIGGTEGIIRGPDTGDGATASRDVSLKLVWAGTVLLFAGAAATAVAAKARRQRHGRM